MPTVDLCDVANAALKKDHTNYYPRVFYTKKGASDGYIIGEAMSLKSRIVALVHKGCNWAKLDLRGYGLIFEGVAVWDGGPELGSAELDEVLFWAEGVAIKSHNRLARDTWEGGKDGDNGRGNLTVVIRFLVFAG